MTLMLMDKVYLITSMNGKVPVVFGISAVFVTTTIQ